MSIYALPGPLFKLVSSGISSAPKSKDVVEVVPSSTKDSSSAKSQCSSLNVSDSIENPLRRRPSTGTCSSSSSSLQHLDASDQSNASSSSSRNHNNSNSNVVIAVKEAKIDPERLIRSLAQSSSISDSKLSAGGKTKSSGDGNEEDTPGSNSTPATRRRRSMKNDMGIKQQVDANEKVCKCDPHEEAIKFEFSVSFNGREYTATRTLPRILQFRVDLIEEFRARRMWRERRRKRKQQSVPPPMAKVTDLSDDEDEEDETIPELPRLSEDAAGSSGFTMLNALLRPYGPALEHWLRKVIDIVPHDSQCLTQFLWEPISGNAAPPSKKFERRRSSSTLIAIEEKDSEDLEELEQYDSDTDEYLLIH